MAVAVAPALRAAAGNTLADIVVGIAGTAVEDTAAAALAGTPAVAGTAAAGRAAAVAGIAGDTAVGSPGAGTAAGTLAAVAGTAAVGMAAAAARTGAAQAAGIAAAQFAAAGAELRRDRPDAGGHRWLRCSTARVAGTAGTDLQDRVSW